MAQPSTEHDVRLYIRVHLLLRNHILLRLHSIDKARCKHRAQDNIAKKVDLKYTWDNAGLVTFLNMGRKSSRSCMGDPAGHHKACGHISLVLSSLQDLLKEGG